jgi:hypothetical protein
VPPTQRLRGYEKRDGGIDSPSCCASRWSEGRVVGARFFARLQAVLERCAGERNGAVTGVTAFFVSLVRLARYRI